MLAGGGDIGGGKTHILSLAKELSKKHEVVLLSFRKGVFADDAIAMGIKTVVVDHTLGIKHAIRRAEALVEKFAPQLIHCHGSKANMIGVILKNAYGIPVVTTVHSDPKLDYMGKPFRKYTFGLINAIALRKIEYHVAVASEMKSLLIRRGFDPYNVFTIFNGIDFDEANDYSEIRNADDVINIGIAARLNPVKDIETIIRAFALAYQEDKRLRLYIAGIGEEERKLKNLATELNVSDVTYFIGWQSDVRAFFRNIDINVLSSLSETFPYSLLEGAIEGCPVIASNAGGIPCLIKHEQTGLLFNCKDVNTFASHILRLAKDEELRKQLAINLFNYAKENYSLNAMAAQQEKIYESILRRSTAPKKRGAIVCGAYGKGNAGDEAILKAITLDLQSIDPDFPIWVMSRNPKKTMAEHGVRSIYIFNPFAFSKTIENASVLLSGGGSLIQDITSTRSLRFYLSVIKEAKSRGLKVMMYGCGIGPIKRTHELLVKRVINQNVDYISLRDSMSKNFLKSIGASRPKIVLAADPAFGLPVADEFEIRKAFLEEKIPEGIKMIGLSLRNWSTFKNTDAVSKALDYAYEKYGLVPVFIPVEVPGDITISEEIANNLSENTPRYICRNLHKDSEFIGMLSKMELVCGMRLHSLIFSAVSQTKTIAFSYDVKVDGFCKDLGNENLISVDSITEDSVKELIDKALSLENNAKDAYLKFKEASLNNVETLKELLEA